MSPRRPGLSGPDHERARELASLRLVEPIGGRDERWLSGHLAECPDCRAIADAYEEQHDLFGVLRDAQPIPPRDLWARTAATIEAEGSRRRPVLGGWRPARWRPGPLALAPIAGLLVLAIAVGMGLLNGVGLTPPGASPGQGGPEPTPIALTAGEVQVLTRAEDGTLELTTQTIEAVCPLGAEACGSPGTTGTTDNTALSTLGDLGEFDAYLSPAQDHIVVVQRGPDARGVFVVPVRAPAASPTPAPVTPAPATPAPGTPSPSPSTSSPSGSPATTPEPSPTASAEPSGSPAASPSPTTSPAETPEQTPEASPTASASPEESPSDVTGSPEPSPSVSPTPTTEASPSPSVAVTPAPDGTIEIAHDVILVGTVSGYSADGSSFAFTARPADGSAGPDVYVWRVTEPMAHPVTTDHASLFAAWVGDRLLVSRVADGSPRTVELDPTTGDETAIGDPTMWRPAVSPDGRTAAWWDGSVTPAADGFTWRPAEGQLVLGSWPDATGRRQVFATGGVGDWDVRWDESGTVLAVWTSSDGADAPGHLSLYLVNRATGMVDLAKPLLEDADAFEGFSLRSGRLAWTAPAAGGDATVKVLAWSGDTVGQLQLVTESGVTVLR